MARQNINPFVPYTDYMMVLFAWSMILVSLLMIFFQSQQKTDKDYHPKAEFMVVLDWDDTRNSDLDLWLKDQNDNLVGYRNKEVENISLDRDSRGAISNKSQNPDGSLVYSGNEEIITIRANVVGNYTIAVVYYSQNGDDNLSIPIDYKLKLFKVNPKITQFYEQSGHLNSVKEINIPVSFHIDYEGKLTVIPTSDKPFFPNGQIP